jgi:hypothetical protein
LNTKHHFLSLVLIWTLVSSAGWAQSRYEFGLLPGINLNSRLKKDWQLNSKLESRQILRSGKFSGISQTKYIYQLTDLSFIAANKIGLNSRLAMGYLVRLEEGEWFHRIIQQYTIIQMLSGYRLAHRISLDQTLGKSESPEFRARYRLTSEIPLNGKSVDPKEFYLKINGELLNSLQSRSYDLEIRIVPILGFDITDRNRIETGLDYRISSFFSLQNEHNFWVSLNWFIEL